MNTNKSPDHDESLGKALRQWTVTVPLPARFQEQVWQRIARAESPPQPALWTTLRRLIEAVVPRPRFAFAYLSVLFVLGIGAGSFTAQIKTSHLNSELRLRYVQSIDPFRTGSSFP